MRNIYIPQYITMSVYVKHAGKYTFICPIYIYDTREYVGSAFLIHNTNYVCHFLKVEGKARPTCHQLCFLLCL